MPFDLSQDSLWQSIANHPMPADGTGRPFWKQLATAHRLRRGTAERAITEYKRFIYLVATAKGARRVPSKAVDAVWHLHMQHSRDYWDVFCAAIGRPIHHSPGGTGRAHLEDYDQTRAAYRAVFGEAPPKGIWRHVNRAQALVPTVFFGAAFVMGLWGLLGGGILPGFFAVIGGLGLSYGIALQTTWGRGYLTFEFYGGWGDANDGDCGGDGGGCGGD